MNKLFTKIAGVTLGFAMAIGVGVAAIGSKKGPYLAHADSTYDITFGSGIGTITGTSSNYTSTWTYSIDNRPTLTISAFNNNSWNNKWTYIKCGRKNVASTATIVTSKIEESVNSVDINITALTASNITSITLYSSSDKSTWDSVGTFTKAVGEQTVAITEPSANLYYKLEFVCTSGSSNGLLTLSGIDYNYSSGDAAPLDTIELRDYPTENVDIGYTTKLSYYALDTNAEEWEGNVTYTTSNPEVVEVNATTGALKALAAGTSDITVYANAGVDSAKVESDPITITVLEDPERIELPVGIYTVTIDAADETASNLPDSRSYEIKAKDGRTWYQNLTVSFENITVDTSYKEYVSAKSTGVLTVTNNSNATFSNVEVHYYKYENDGVGVYVDDEILTPTSSTGTSSVDSDLYRGYSNITGNTFALKNKNASYDNKYYSITITLSVVDESEEFLSLTIDKGTTAASFNEGDAPNATGLTVYENYTTDGETISRSENVTEHVVWNYSIETILADTTSYTVTATYGGHTTSSVTIDGFTVIVTPKYTHIESQDELFDGEVVILGMVGTYNKSVASFDSSKNILTVKDANVADGKIASDSEMEFTVRMFGTQFALEDENGSFLHYSGSSNAVYLSEKTLSSETPECGWILDDDGMYSVAGERSLKYNTSSPRFACYGPGSYPVVQLFKAETSIMSVQNQADTFLYRELHLRDIATTDNTDGTACQGDSGYYQTAKAAFLAESFADARSYVLANEDAVARLSAWARANGEEFNSNNGTFSANLNARDMFNSGDNNDTAILIVVIAIASISTFGCLLLLKKKRKHQ